MPLQPLTSSNSSAGLTVKLWRGERMVLIGMDVDQPEADLVGFSIEVQSPGSPNFLPLRNRLAFDYTGGATVNGARNFDSTSAPFQKFRWLHFPYQPQDGIYQYRVTKQHMHDDSTLYAGVSLTSSIDLQTVIAKPTSISGKPAWFERFYVAGSQAERDRQLFSH